MAHLAPRLLHFEEALEKTGWGLYYKFLVGFSAVNLFVNGWLVTCVYFAVPLSACDTYLTKTDLLTVFYSFSFGRVFGSFALLALSDNGDKRKMVTRTEILLFLSSFLAAFSHNMYTMWLALFGLGTGLPVNAACMKIYLAEILPIGKRGLYTLLPDVLWTIGCFTPAVLLYFFGTTSVNLTEHQIMDMRLTSWRVIFALGGGLFLTLGCSSALLDMSPRYLLFKRRVITASLVLKQFYSINKSKYSESFEIQSHQLVDLIKDYNILLEPEPVGMIQEIVATIKIIIRMLRLLMKRPFLKAIITLTAMKLPFAIGIFGFCIFWAQNLTPTATINGTQFVHLDLTVSKNCSVQFDDAIFQNFLLLFINILFGQIVSMVLTEGLGRKTTICKYLTRQAAYKLPIGKLIVGGFVCSLSTTILIFLQKFTIIAVFISIFIVGETMIESTLFLLNVECFPTAIRGTAMGVSNFYANFVCLFIYIFLNMSRQAFLVISSIFLLGTTILACFLPEMKGRPMVE